MNSSNVIRKSRVRAEVVVKSASEGVCGVMVKYWHCVCTRLREWLGQEHCTVLRSLVGRQTRMWVKGPIVVGMLEVFSCVN